MNEFWSVLFFFHFSHKSFKKNKLFPSKKKDLHFKLFCNFYSNYKYFKKMRNDKISQMKIKTYSSVQIIALINFHFPYNSWLNKYLSEFEAIFLLINLFPLEDDQPRQKNTFFLPNKGINYAVVDKRWNN